jgi:hypothetical protein
MKLASSNGSSTSHLPVALDKSVKWCVNASFDNFISLAAVRRVSKPNTAALSFNLGICVVYRLPVDQARRINRRTGWNILYSVTTVTTNFASRVTRVTVLLETRRYKGFIISYPQDLLTLFAAHPLARRFFCAVVW